MKSPKSIITLICTLAVIATILIIAIASFERQNIYDFLALINYTPPSSIQDIAAEDGMTSYTTRVFYVNHPQIDGKSTFAKVCPNNSEQTVVLGCYHTGQKGIYVLAVNNSQLTGIEQVTAAYETLHAIYQRLSPSAQKTLNSELISFENNGLNNQIVKQQIAGFRKSEPGAVLNEMTSLFGTEVQNLPAPLANFYAKYFKNRQILLNFYDHYESAFTEREAQISSDDQQLTSLDRQINTDETTLAHNLSQINSEQTTINSDRSSGQIAEYNQMIGSYNQQVITYNDLVTTLKSLVTEYNQIVVERNSLVLVYQQLAQSITSSTNPISN